MANVEKIKHKLSALIHEFSNSESSAPFTFDIEGSDRKRDILVIVRIIKNGETKAFWKTIFKIKSERHLDVFRTFLQFLASANLQQQF